MQVAPLTRRGRDQILQTFARAKENYQRAAKRSDEELAAAQRLAMNRAKAEYFARLPRPVMSVCPHCGRQLLRSFDPYGLDGLWWRSAASVTEPPACPHFCLLQGAVNYHGLRPRAGEAEVRPGPEVPFVVPRLLEMPGMVCVVSELRMSPGYTAYPLAYFAARRPPPETLTAGWNRTEFTFVTQMGVEGWRVPQDAWDFELLPWLKNNSVRWCEPQSGNSTLSNAAPEDCPYLNSPGRRERVVVQEDLSWTEGLPGIGPPAT